MPVWIRVTPLAFVVLCGCSLLKAPSYEAVELPFTPRAMNNEGAVIGTRALAPPLSTEGVIWQDGAVSVLEAPEDSFANPFHINDAGLIAGRFGSGTNAPIQVWVEGVPSELPPPSNAPELALLSVAGLNNAGDLVGYALAEGEMPFPQTVPVLHRADGTAEALPYFEPGALSAGSGSWPSFPADINDAGVIAGTADIPATDSTVSYPVVWEDGAITRLRTPGALYGRANAVNNEGWVAGSVHSSGSAWTPSDSKPVIWIDGRMRRLWMHGADAAGAFHINDRGDVLATYERQVQDWGENGAAGWHFYTILWRWIDVLNLHIPVNLTEIAGVPGLAEKSVRGLGINNAGQILIRVTDIEDLSTETHYLLTPVS